MAEKYLTPKGFRDFLPQQEAKRKFILEKLEPAIKSFGFDSLETPALEYADVLKGKYGEEEKLIFEFKDRGDREVALRYDQTVPLARVVASNPTLPLPFKRYQFQPVWRAEKPQKGRFREFVQFDFDIVGSDSIMADAETITAAISGAQSLGISKFLIKINDRDVFQGLSPEVIRALDKMEKIGEIGVLELLKKEGYDTAQGKGLLSRLRTTQPTKKISKLFSTLEDFKIDKDKYAFFPTLARGLDYYTGIIYEMEIEGYTGGSVGSGGRYDDLIGKFTEKDTPAVGFSFGIDRLVEALDQTSVFPTYRPNTKVLVTLFDESTASESVSLVSKLRKQGIQSEISLDAQEKLDKQIKYANNKGIPFVIFLGPEEVKSQVFTLKNLETGQQEKLKLNDLVKKLK
jgi:histidyl-tRNA synthetase